MGFYIRKSLKVGPVRLNLSRSGLGYSVGVKGFRVGVGPKGKYVHAGRGGLYYRKSLGSGKPLKPQEQQQFVEYQEDHLEEIDSGDIENIKDEASAGLIEALSKAQGRRDWFYIVLGITVLLLPFGWPIIFMVPLAIYARHKDVTNGTVVLRYDLEEKAESAFGELKSAFDEIMECNQVGHIEAAGKNSNLKMNAGADTTVRRSIIQPKLSTPNRISCPLEAPTLPAGKETLYFYPDRILVVYKDKVGAVSYLDLITEHSSTKFVESNGVPADAKVVDSTWQYVNKKGGPDRRFKDNRELPIALYGELALKSESGLNELFQTSKVEPLERFSKALQGMKELGFMESPVTPKKESCSM